MEPDKYQQAWQAQSHQTRVTIGADVLLKAVQRNQRDFRTAIFWGELNAIGITLLLLPVWIYMGVTTGSPWTWYLMVPVLVWEVGFTLIYRMRHPQRPSEPGEPLVSCVMESLALVEQQIWLYRNFFWWNLLPTSIAMLAFFAQVSWQAYEPVAKGWLDIVGLAGAFVAHFVFLFAVFYFVHYIIQRTVRTQYEPRRQELLALLASLTDQTTSEVSGEFPILTGTKRVGCTPRRVRIASLCFWPIMVLGIAAILIAFRLTAPIRDQLLGVISNSSYSGPARDSGRTGDALARVITEQRKEKKLVGLAAMLVVDGQLEAAAAEGERKIGSGVPVDTGDRWHLGGISKSITATMIARLIESGKMHWSDTVGTIFPEASVDADWKPVTLRQLLTDTAGAPRNFPKEVWSLRPTLGRECTEARREAVLNVIAAKPDSPPGEKFAYSNVGYVIAGSMAEKVTGVSWEDLVKQQVFEPLELSESGFGPPKSADETLPQPRGHLTVLGGKIPEDDQADNTPIMGPSATIHMTLRDLCTFANEHLRGDLGKGKLLSADSYKLLHAPELSHYACGWIRKEPSKDIPYTVYWHNGSNTLWYALVVFIPEKKMVVAVTSNDGDFVQAEAAAWEVVKASVKEIKVEAEPTRRKSLQKADYPKRAPFTGVRWDGDKPVVKIGEEWFTLVSLDGVAAGDIVAFSRRTYANKWQKRFEEDLVEVLTKMGHEPKDTVRLVVSPLGSRVTRTLENVPMTEANRRVIYDAALARERDGQRPAKKKAAAIRDPKAPLTDLIPSLRKENNLVGLAAMVMVDGKDVESAVDGERRNGSGVRLEIGDRWHLGSITKSITATMIARLVDSGKMKFSDTIGARFAGAAIHDAWKPVTLQQLLTHTAGAPNDFSFLVRLKQPPLGPECTLARREAVLQVLVDKPENPPGVKFAYSNIGYTIASVMAEKATGASWEDLVKREVFEPLKLTGAGFGPPKSPDETLPQPRGHRPLFDWKIAMEDDADNTPIMGPSGSVHMTLGDLCTYATEHLRGDLGTGKLLSAETYKLLHAPVLDHYACGWVKKEPNAEIPHTVYWHNGSNTMWYALVVFIPEKKMVVAVTSNDGDVEQAEAAAWEIVKVSVNRRAIKAEAEALKNVER